MLKIKILFPTDQVILSERLKFSAAQTYRKSKNQYFCGVSHEKQQKGVCCLLEDREMIRQIQNGQKQYLNAIAEKYYNDIYYFCCYQTSSREDAYDLAQETFLRFIRYVDRYQYRNLKGYLLTIAMNLCRNYACDTKKAFARQEPFAREQGDLSEAEPAGFEGREYENQENSLLLAAALQKLPVIQREAVLLHYFYGYKNREISRMTGASYSAVKSRIRQGLEKLQQLLNREDFYG